MSDQNPNHIKNQEAGALPVPSAQDIVISTHENPEIPTLNDLNEIDNRRREHPINFNENYIQNQNRNIIVSEENQIISSSENYHPQTQEIIIIERTHQPHSQHHYNNFYPRLHLCSAWLILVINI